MMVSCLSEREKNDRAVALEGFGELATALAATRSGATDGRDALARIAGGGGAEMTSELLGIVDGLTLVVAGI